MHAPHLDADRRPQACRAAAQGAARRGDVRRRSAAAATATDASIYQIEPVGVVVPRDKEDVGIGPRHRRARKASPCCRAAAAPRNAARPSARRWCSTAASYMNSILEVDVAQRRAVVQPGLVLDRLNKTLRKDGLFFPVDVSTSSRATLGGMAANNSCGSRSIRYGNMVHNVRAIDALLADGTAMRMGEVAGQFRRELRRPARALSRPRPEDAGAAPPRGRRDRPRASRSCCARSAATTST